MNELFQKLPAHVRVSQRRGVTTGIIGYAMNDQAKQKLLQSLTPEERRIVDVIARPDGIEQLTVQQIWLALDQARHIGDL